MEHGRQTPKELADHWNGCFPIGTPVTRYKLINPLREPQETKTRSKAWVMGGHTAMVMVEGVSGGVMVESVVPLSVEGSNEAIKRPSEETEDTIGRQNVLKGAHELLREIHDWMCRMQEHFEYADEITDVLYDDLLELRGRIACAAKGWLKSRQATSVQGGNEVR